MHHFEDFGIQQWHVFRMKADLSPDELVEVLRRLVDPRFVLPVEMLSNAARHAEVRISVAPRLSDTRELSEIYAARQDRCAHRDQYIPGLPESVAVFSEHPDAGWRIVGVFAPEVVGAVFVAQPGENAVACIASTAESIEQEETPRDPNVVARVVSRNE